MPYRGELLIYVLGYKLASISINLCMELITDHEAIEKYAGIIIDQAHPSIDRIFQLFFPEKIADKLV